MRYLLTLILGFVAFTLCAQLPINEEQFLSRLQTGHPMPENLLKTKSAVFYQYQLTQKELSAIHKAFQRSGIDAVVYYESDYVYAGRDPLVRLASVLNSREIANLIYVKKVNGAYTIYITPYNRKANLVEADQKAWSESHTALDVLLQQLYRTAANSMRNENLLINDIPETGFYIRAIEGTRNEYYAADLKVDALAVPKFADEEMNKQLEELMKQYPYKYQLTDPTLSEADLKKQGFFFVLRFVSARNKIARSILEYEGPKGQNAIVSTRFAERTPQLKSIHVNDAVFKFYFKHLESANVFLGTKWDADQSWMQALQNQLTGYKVEFRIE